MGVYFVALIEMDVGMCFDSAGEGTLGLFCRGGK